MIPMISKLVAADVTPMIVRIDKNGIDSSTLNCSSTVGFSVILDFQAHQLTLLDSVKTKLDNRFTRIFLHYFTLTDQLAGENLPRSG